MHVMKGRSLLSHAGHLTIYRMTEVEETVCDRTRSLSMLQVRTKFLEEETSRLQDHVDTLSQQKHSLDRLVKDLRLGKDRDVSSYI